MNRTILRNLCYTLKRFRTASLLNLLGLSAAFSAFILIMMKVNYERNFDTCYPDYDRVALVSLISEKEGISPLPRPLTGLTNSQMPGIAYSSLLAPAWEKTCVYTNPQEPRYVYENCSHVEQDFAKVLGLTFVEGNDKGLYEPDGAILPESKARQLFPQGNAVGSYLYIKGENFFNPQYNKFLISGVYKDLPENTQFGNDIYMRIDDKMNQGDWGSYSFLFFVRLKDGVSYDTFNRQLKENKLTEKLPAPDTDETEYRAIPLYQLFYSGEKAVFFFQTGNKANLYLMCCIAVLVIGIAVINLINFSTALTPMRIRSINTQKVLGSSIRSLRIGLVAESIGLVLLGWLFSLLIVGLLIHLRLLDFIGFTPSLVTYWGVILLSFCIALGTGVIAGLYPAWYMTSFPPALMLKGNFALSGKGRTLRNLLISFQYIVSFVLIVCAVLIYRQNQHLLHADTGYDRETLLTTMLPDYLPPADYQPFEARLLSNPAIEGIAYSNAELGTRNTYGTQNFNYQDYELYPFRIHVSPTFFKVMGIKVIEGRDFLPSDTARSVPVCMATQSIRDTYHIPTGMITTNHGQTDLAGYVEEVVFTSNHQHATPSMFWVNYTRPVHLPYAYIRMKEGSDVSTLFPFIRETIEKCFPGYSADVRFFNQGYQKLYEKEMNQQHLITLFSLLAVLISLVGIFGLAIFEMGYRKKEIGVRKVYGATTKQILWTLNLSYLKIVTLCSLIATPIAWYSMHRWLQDFSVRIDIGGGVFIATYLLIGLLTFLTITIQSYRATNENPIHSIKTE